MIRSNKKIRELVSENYIYASVLYFFGIEFYEYKELTLQQVCSQKGLNLRSVIQRLENAVSARSESRDNFGDFPIDLLIEYLKHAHHTFVKQKLPYIARCIDRLDCDGNEYNLSRDLKFVFPLFIEDFIKHIYEEEDTLFSYIITLNKVSLRKLSVGKVFFQMEKYTIQNFAIEHEVHEDEMSGMRKITNNYDLTQSSNVGVRVVLSELKAFDEELKLHARIEDEILFPKALLLEQEVKNMIRKTVSFN